MKLEALCGCGLGSSFMVQMNIENLLKQEGVQEEIKVGHSDVGSATPADADYFLMDATLTTAANNLPKERVIVLNNLVDANELKKKVNAVLDKESIVHH